MKKVVMFLLVGIFLMNAAGMACVADSVTGPIVVSTLDYRDFDYIMLSGDGEVFLEYLSSDFDRSALSVSKIVFFNDTNMTKYLLESNDVEPSENFIPGVMEYFFQDVGSGQVYVFKLDLSDVEAPEDSLEGDYLRLQQNYSVLLGLYQDAINETEDISVWLDAVFDLENYSSLGDAVEDVVAMWNTTESNLVSLQSEYTSLNLSYHELVVDYDKKNSSYDDLLSSFGNLSISYQNVNDSLTEKKKELADAKNNLSNYQTFLAHLQGNVSFEYNGMMYEPLSYYVDTIHSLSLDLHNERSMQFWYVLVSVLLGVVIGGALLSILKKKIKSRSQIEDESGHNIVCSIADRFCAYGRKGFDMVFHPRKNRMKNRGHRTAVPSIVPPSISKSGVEEKSLMEDRELGEEIASQPPSDNDKDAMSESDKKRFLADLKEYMEPNFSGIRSDIADVQIDLGSVKNRVSSLEKAQGKSVCSKPKNSPRKQGKAVKA